MKLKKANLPTPIYPIQRHLKPMLLSITVMAALGACHHKSDIKPPLNPTGVATPPPTMEGNQTQSPPLDGEKNFAPIRATQH